MKKKNEKLQLENGSFKLIDIFKSIRLFVELCVSIAFSWKATTSESGFLFPIEFELINYFKNSENYKIKEFAKGSLLLALISNCVLKPKLLKDVCPIEVDVRNWKSSCS